MRKPRLFPWTQAEIRQLCDYDPATGVFSKDGHKLGTGRPDGRWQITLNGTTWLASRLAYFWMTGEQVPTGQSIDHVNRNRGDDRWENLRLANPTEQAKNRACVEFKAGYYFNKSEERWIVSCTTKTEGGPRRTHLFGRFTCEDRARRAAELMKEEMQARLTLDAASI